MHVLLTDRLSCPRCGPEFGLILLADRVEERRVLEGLLGCSNCRDRFPVSGGFADLRTPPREPLEGEAAPAPPDDAVAERLQALLGVAEGPGQIVVVGPAAVHAPALARRTPDVEVVAVSPALAGAEEAPRVSRLAARPGLPFFPRTFRGVVLSGDASPRLLDEAVRVLAPGARVVVLDAGEEVRARLEAAGVTPLLDDRDERVAVGLREKA